jgi:hypothetical protein
MQPVELLNKHLGAIVGVPIAAAAGYAAGRMQPPSTVTTTEAPPPPTNMADSVRLQLLQRANTAPTKSDKDYYLRLTQLPDDKLIALVG